MYAIVDIAGQQVKVEKDQKLFVNLLEGEVGAEVKFDKVLLVDNDGKVTIGKPEVKSASVTAKILNNVKGDKLKNGHRQQYTQIQISEIVA